LDERALRHELYLHRAVEHLPLGLGIEADMAYDRLSHQLRAYQLADAGPRPCRVIGDDGELALALAHQLVHEAFRRAHTHEPANHQACPVRDHGDRTLERDRLQSPLACSATATCRRGQSAHRRKSAAIGTYTEKRPRKRRIWISDGYEGRSMSLRGLAV